MLKQKRTVEDNRYRLESDYLGEKKVPANAYFGVQTLRAFENFPVSGLSLHGEFIKNIALVKKAAAVTNYRCGLLDKAKADAIITACDEISSGGFSEQFIVDPIQGGAGTSFNMNANEVISNRAIQILGGARGDYTVVHPNDDVNKGQSTNDVIPTAGRLTTLKLLSKAEKELCRLEAALAEKAGEFDHILKMGRTQMQDAVPLRLGQEFSAYAGVIQRDIIRLEQVKKELRVVNLGGTAIGTSVCADPRYVRQVVQNLAEITGLGLVQAENLVDATQNLDTFALTSAVIKVCGLNLSKIANDLRLLSSGPHCGFNEIHLPPRQNGSSIMPGKVNPVIAEVVNQVAFKIAGNDLTVALAVEAGQLELNPFAPVIFSALFESVDILGRVAATFTDNCLTGIRANEDRCRELLEGSAGFATVLCPYIGYAKAAQIVKQSEKTGKNVRELVLSEQLLASEELDAILEPFAMTGPALDNAISGSDKQISR